MRISFALCRFLLTSLTCARRKLVTTKMMPAASCSIGGHQTMLVKPEPD